MTTFILGPTSSDAVEIFPNFDFKDSESKIEQSHRLQNGDLYSYKTGQYVKFNFSYDYVPASDAALINSWWQSNTPLLFWQDTECSSVMLVGNEKPIGYFQKPYTDLFRGTIKLEGY